MTETELKFCVPDEVLPSLRAALLAHGARRLRLRAHYFDTADGALAQARLALRLRLEGRRWVQTLKGAGDGIVHRLEHEVRVACRAGVRPDVDPQRHAGTPAGEKLLAVLAKAGSAALLEQHATDISRLHVQITDAGGSCIEVALDNGRALAGALSTPICELELEHKGGPLQGLFDLATACVHHGGLWQSALTKAERGQRLRQAAQAAAEAPDQESATLPPRAVKATAPALSAASAGPALMRALLQSALEQVLANASELQPAARPEASAETVHQLRVGLRRLRVLLRELPDLCPAIDPAWAEVLAAAFGRLGEQRDHVAVVAAVRPLLLAAGAPLLEWTAPAAADPARVVREPDFQATLLALLALAHAPDSAFTPLTPPQVRAEVAARLQSLQRKLERTARGFEKLPLEEQHRVRRQLKRLRYLLEFTAALWPARRMRALRPLLSAAQDALGLHQDVSVAADAMRLEALQRPEAAFAAGWLLAHLAVTARASQRALRRLVRQPVPWRGPAKALKGPVP